MSAGTGQVMRSQWLNGHQPHPAFLISILPTSSVKDNYLYIKEIKNLVNKAGCDLKVCFGYINRGDRWMQVGEQKGGGKAFLP